MTAKLPPPVTEDTNSEIALTVISPIAYQLAREGDIVEIRRQAPRKNEYRSNIGASTEAFLVFKGVTKIGMIPKDAVSKIGKTEIGRRCRIVRMAKDTNIIAIKLLRQRSSGCT